MGTVALSATPYAADQSGLTAEPPLPIDGRGIQRDGVTGALELVNCGLDGATFRA